MGPDPICSDLVNFSSICSTLVGSISFCSALVGLCPIYLAVVVLCSALVGSSSCSTQFLLHPGGLLFHLLGCGGPLLCPGGLQLRLLWPGELQFHLLCPGGLMSHLLGCGGPLHCPDGLQFHLLGCGGRLLRPGRLQLRLFCPGGLQFLLHPVPAPPWISALLSLPQAPATPLPRGLGPPSLPSLCLRSTTLLNRKVFGASGSRSLWGWGEG
ncbi:uncharacterized protein LOC127979437 [Carassius gibelio]|uniref:uncharacterized protein LOC127979437 n=1 Tax=Carassius gibelio TaxID=101364 RepID=UPI0022788976|nr:uncharacterized protein LOC127979437 [Carassius gibelio]